MKSKLLLLAGIIILIISGSYLWWKQAIKSSNPNNTANIVFTIKKGETIKDIAERLQKNELIRSPVAFFILARFGGLAEKIQAGEFRLNQSMDMITLANTLTHGTSDLQITIPEGWRNEEIALILAKNLNIPENEFLKIARVGYMFPDTYFIPRDATVGAVKMIFSDNFAKKVSQNISGENKKLSIDEIISIASLVEREAKFDSDRPIVASVIINRLKIGMKLDIDATVQYALGYQTKEKTWLNKELTGENLEIDSPFNTYKNQGLPPTPISNPGLAAILAVVDAPETEYIYYISDKSGKVHPARTIEEHNANISRYLNR